jgi:hypothetical protein
MRQLLDEAAKNGYGVGAFSVNNMEQIQAIMEAARETRSPVIIQASRGSRAYSNDRFLFHLMLCRQRGILGDPDGTAPGSRQQSGNVQICHRDGFH